MADPHDEIALLRRRLDRERRTREAAETIAETSTRELYQRQQRLHFLQRIAEVANGTDSVEKALGRCLDEICLHTGWPAGHCYVVDREHPDRLLPTDIWNATVPELFAAFRAISSQTPLLLGQGLPGRVATTRGLVWVEDVECDPNFPRADALPRPLPMTSAVGFPVLMAGHVVAVLELFTPHRFSIDDSWPELAQQISTQLARVFERRDQAERLHDAALAAEAGLRAKSAFLAVMSHEIRTPMNGVIGFTQLLLATALDEEQREYTTTIQRSADALLGIINDILDFSKLEADKLTVDAEPFELRSTIADVAELMSHQADQKGIELVLRVDAEVPARAVGDGGRLRQVLLNLVGNAVKFTDAGYVLIEVCCEGLDVEHLRIAVTDTGIGIAPEKQDQLFSRFTQVDASTTRRFGGTGLGLAIARGIVECMGGQVGLTSSPGAGSTFSFTVPLVRDRDPLSLVTPPGFCSGTRVLIVDDLAVNRRVLALQLEAWGLLCDHACNGAEAIALTQQARSKGRPYQLAILDYLMPGMDGETLGGLLLQEPEPPALILLTSGGHRVDARRFLQMGFAAYVMKPVARPAVLLSALVRALSPPDAPSQATSVAAERTTPAAGVASAHAGQRVLVAEDNPVNRRLAALLLRKLGVAFDTAEDGAQAVRMQAEAPYDAIFMDCQMPECDGFEAARRIRQAEGPHRRTPIIALTANVAQNARERCTAAGMDDYVTKPVGLSDLAAALKRWLPAVDRIA